MSLRIFGRCEELGRVLSRSLSTSISGNKVTGLMSGRRAKYLNVLGSVCLFTLLIASAKAWYLRKSLVFDCNNNNNNNTLTSKAP